MTRARLDGFKSLGLTIRLFAPGFKPKVSKPRRHELHGSHTSPYPDDILCCGVIYRNADNVLVMYVTDGSKGSSEPEERGRELALRRMNEACSVLSKLRMRDKSGVLFLRVEDGSVAKNFAKVYGQLPNMPQRSDIAEIYFPSPLDAPRLLGD